MKKLHDLIHSLNQGEKRYVKIRLKGNKSSSLLNIYFAFLSKQKTYFFEDIQNAGNQSKTLTQSNLSLLYEIVLNHLCSRYRNKNFEYSLRGDLSTVKILMDKGFVAEAKSHCKKLIQKAEHKEEFEVLKSAYKEYWNLHLLNGELDHESNDEIQTQLRLMGRKEQEIFELEDKYRLVTTLYYDYFFKKRDSKYRDQIKQITSSLDGLKLNSDKANHVLFEIKSIEYIVHGDLDSHHEIRKKQLKNLINSPVFEVEHLLRLMVLSNVFTKLKSQALVNELKAYLIFMEDYFKPVLEGDSDSVFMEKYYDIYFSNQSFIQTWLPNQVQLKKLLDQFKFVISKGYLSNPILIGRIYLSLIELQIIVENYKETAPLLTNFFSLSKNKKYSKHYIAGDLLFLLENYLQGKMDTFDNAIESLNRKIRRNEIDLDQDQKTLLELLNDLYKSIPQDTQVYIDRISNKQTYKLFIYMLTSTKSVIEIRAEHFPINDSNYAADRDTFLLSLGKY